MTVSTRISLYKKLLSHIRQLQDDIEYRKNGNRYLHQAPYPVKKSHFKNYPCFSVGCQYNEVEDLGDQRSYVGKDYFCDQLKNTLVDKLGELNHNSIHYPACENKVGHCAEDFAANKVLDECSQKGVYIENLNQLAFTEPIQPRTWMLDVSCMNCHTIFD